MKFFKIDQVINIWVNERKLCQDFKWTRARDLNVLFHQYEVNSCLAPAHYILKSCGVLIGNGITKKNIAGKRTIEIRKREVENNIRRY